MLPMWLYILLVLCLAYSVCGTILYIMQPTFLYKPVRSIVYTPKELELDFEHISLESPDGVKLEAWYIPARKDSFTILFCHGNGGNMMHRLDSINIFHNLGLNCFIFDYRGYGNSEGKISENGTYLDARTAYDWLVGDKKVQADNIIFFGRSLGGSIAAKLATEVEVGGLVVESCFTSYADIGRKFYPYMPVKLFARFNYNTLNHIKKITCPVMVVHSRTDEIVPFEFGLELYRAVNSSSKFVEIFGSHNDGFLISSEIYKKAWTDWLKSLKSGIAESKQAN